jgi:hypothetical protein
MENFRAHLIMVACGVASEAKSTPATRFSKFVKTLLPHPLAYGSTDVDLITGTENFPAVTQSETYTSANPDNPNEIVVAYNDSSGAQQLFRRIGFHRWSDLHPAHPKPSRRRH